MRAQDIVFLFDGMPLANSGNSSYRSVVLAVDVCSMNEPEKRLYGIDLRGFWILENGAQDGEVEVLLDVLFAELVSVLADIAQQVNVGQEVVPRLAVVFRLAVLV